MNRFDLRYGREGGLDIDLHFCRDWDADGGCYGTNPHHGLTFEEARDEIVAWHERKAGEWREMTLEKWKAENGVSGE